MGLLSQAGRDLGDALTSPTCHAAETQEGSKRDSNQPKEILPSPCAEACTHRVSLTCCLCLPTVLTSLVVRKGQDGALALWNWASLEGGGWPDLWKGGSWGPFVYGDSSSKPWAAFAPPGV